jgi:hypothetical protein
VYQALTGVCTRDSKRLTTQFRKRPSRDARYRAAPSECDDHPEAISTNANGAVRLGPGKEVARRDCVTPTFPYGKAPIATYVFQYRTRSKSTSNTITVTTSTDRNIGDLEIEGIVERPHPLVPLEERDPNDLTPHELREELRLLRAAASKVKVKEEPKREKRARSVTLGVDDNDGDDDVTITSVSDRRKRARASAETIEVLDLTED